MIQKLNTLSQSLDGSLHYDRMLRSIYATDASIYREIPLAVAYPKNKNDLKKIIAFCRDNQTSIIPRTAGTSLAGQCVGDGIVVDVSRHFNKVLKLNAAEKWVLVEPGVVRDELNNYLAEHGLFFGPNTSTANRCMIGGMVGNNSSGTTSIKYGVTRDHVLALETVLSDGSEAVFSKEKIEHNNSLQNEIEEKINALLEEPGAREDIINSSPKQSIHRRNTGYALDLLARQEGALDLTPLLTGSEGTLALTTAIKINLSELPPKHVKLICVHFNSINESMKAVLTAMEANPYACELMDKIILDCTKGNAEQTENRFFVEGDPAAVLVIELRNDDLTALKDQSSALIEKLQKQSLGYAWPVVSGEDSSKVWNLRAAGLGLLSNIPGEAKPIACIEDTAVDVNDLPDYIAEFERLMKSFEQESVYYAHAGAGELHLRPILNLKDKDQRQKFKDICLASAKLVKKYNGSLSGEHGDGRVRAEFIPLMVGEENYTRFRRVKQIWDENNIFNPGKIVNAKPIDEDLRYTEGQKNHQIETALDFSTEGGIIEASEKCNGSADCRKITGAMCPSYHATKDEKTTTRARANVIREVLTQGSPEAIGTSEDLRKVLELCVSCKACKRECPSNVDMSALKSEVFHQFHLKNGVPLKTKAIGHLHRLQKIGMLFPGISNFIFKNPVTSSLVKSVLGISKNRTLPFLNSQTFTSWYRKNNTRKTFKKTVYFFADEFMNYSELELGIKTKGLLNKLGYEVCVIDHEVSGRTYISKGMLEEAKACAEKNVSVFKNRITEKTPLIGVEPSAILSFRDEYPKLLRGSLQEDAKSLAKNCLTIEEFLAKESKTQDFSEFFTQNRKEIKVHVHCHQKALSKQNLTQEVLSIPKNYSATLIPGGCCGMAGSFGYEKEHYDISMKMGNLQLFPLVKKSDPGTIIAASGTSCRHQIKDGTGKEAQHPVAILYDALLS